MNITQENHIDNDQLERRLRQLCQTESGAYLRPFAPNPEWRSARVLIVGTNPATPLRNEFPSFDEYWRVLTSDPAAFDAIYLGLRQGKPSKTTRRANLFATALEGVNVLRANACAYPTGRWGELRGAEKAENLRIGREILGTLIDICRPKAVLCHGKEAVQAASTLFSTYLDPYTPLDQQNNVVKPWQDEQSVHLFAYPHLSGLGVAKGFAVSSMDAELTALGSRLGHEIRSFSQP